MKNIDTTNLSVEQKVVLHLANKGYITAVGDVIRALKDQSYADFLVTGNGLSDEGVTEDCNHESLTNDEIQVVFDNDED
jgi:hypothetical protein